MLWDIIRDFFVQYIFGGIDTQGIIHNSLLGYLEYYQNGEYQEGYSEYNNIAFFKIGELSDKSIYYISMADWLSTTATIIVLIGICVALFFFIRWLFRLTSGLFLGR